MALKVFKSNSWQTATGIQVKKSGVWQTAKTVWKKINGDWIQLYNSAPWTWYIKLSSSNIWLPLTNDNISLNAYTDSDNQEYEGVDLKYVNPLGEDYVVINSIESSSYRTIIRSGDVSPSFDAGSNEIRLDSNIYGTLPTSATFYIAIYSDETEVVRSTNYATLTIHEPIEQ